MIRKGVVFGFLFVLLAFQTLLAQRPVPQTQQFPGVGQTARQGRELVDPQEAEETDGRRPLLDDSTRQVFGPKTCLLYTSDAADE